MNERWDEPTGIELVENEDALRRMRVIAWMLVALVAAGVCLVLGVLQGLLLGKAG
jgi:hypothetical protein